MLCKNRVDCEGCLTGGQSDYASRQDGTSWTSRNSGISSSLNGVAYGNSTFVTVGGSGTILSSSDNGTSWTGRVSGTGSTLNGINYGNSTFVTVGSSGTILSSPDGTASYSLDNGTKVWTPRTSGTSNTLNGVASQ